MTIALIVVGVLLVAEILALIWLAQSVGSYKKFWENKAKESGEITYLALGDSAAQSIGASSPMKGYVGLIAKRLEQKTGKTVRIVNVSKTGATIEDCLKEQIPKIKDIKADYVTIEIGANDVRGNDAEKFQKNVDKLLPLLPEGTYMTNMPLFNSRPSSTQPAKDYTKIIEEKLSKQSRIKLVDLQTVTMNRQSIFGFAPDLFHPNNLSYKNWADAFWQEIEKDI